MGTATRRSLDSMRCGSAPASRLVAGIVVYLTLSTAEAGSWIIEPRANLSLDYSSNMALAATAPQRGWIGDAAFGLNVNGAGERIKGFLDYQRDFLEYSSNSQWNRQLNNLKSFANIEAAEKWLYLDVSANVVQRNLVVFAPTSVNQTNAGASLGETKTNQVAPYIRGHLFGNAEYLLRADAVDSRSDDQLLAPTRVGQLVGSVKSLANSGVIGWFTDFNRTNVRNDILDSRNDNRIRGGIVLPVGERAHLSLSEGRESTDFASQETDRLTTPGVGFDWQPSQHTKIAALGERRFYGNGHNILVHHTTAMTAWRYTDVKDIAILPLTLSGFNPGSIYELMANLLEASIADPLERSRAVRARMDQLGAAAPAIDGAGVQTSRFYIDRLQEASFAILGKRNTVTFVLSQRMQELPDFAPVAVDNFSQFDSRIRQRNGTLTWLHLLTPQTAMNLGLIRIKTDGLTTDLTQSTETIATATMTMRVAPKLSAALSLHQTRGNSSVTGSYRENALMGSVVKRF